MGFGFGRRAEFGACAALAAVFSVFSLLAGCDGTDQDHSPPRIVFGESVDGVAFGDDFLSAVEKLGQPTCSAPNEYGHTALIYEEGVHAGLSIQLSSESDGREVYSFDLSSSFAGKNAEGVGIGSTRAQVEKALGETMFDSGQIRSDEPDVTLFVYPYPESGYEVGVRYRRDRAELISMATGHFFGEGLGLVRPCSEVR